MPKLAIIQFPGSNCIRETAAVLEYVNCDYKIVRWNQAHLLKEMAGIIIPGGFSYQDRIRAGIIAASLPISDQIKAAGLEGKPVLGICNGCQVLAETDLIPQFSQAPSKKLALDHNRLNNQAMGFLCDWQYVKLSQSNSCVFTQGLPEDLAIPVPINHGEGRFVCQFDSAELKTSCYIQYSDATGTIDSKFPINPNSSQYNLAGISNAKGNILALMPHPERAIRPQHFPSWIKQNQQNWWLTFFKNIKKAIQS